MSYVARMNVKILTINIVLFLCYILKLRMMKLRTKKIVEKKIQRSKVIAE